MAQVWLEKVSSHTISRRLKKIKFTRKKAESRGVFSGGEPRRTPNFSRQTYGYKERDEKLHASFQDEIGQLDPKKLVYIDESGIDNRDTYDYGWNEKGTRFFALKQGKRSTRVSIIAALHQEKLIAPLTSDRLL